ncbi:MAG: response regulator [Spirochaetaceae bacterium]|nr:response regulator [Spirochaetaceae bacterium]
MTNRRKTILAVDDDITILNTIRSVLEGSYEVSLAKNTDIAKTILNTTRIDLILLDMNMPGISGMDFLEFVRNDNSYYHIPVIIVSSQGTADIIVEIKKQGATDFVVKPISPNILKEKIRSSLKEASVKTSRMSLEIKLKRLSLACAAGKSGNVEEIVKDLEQVYFDHSVDAEIAEICKYARDMEYNSVDRKVKQLLVNLSN